MYFAPCYYPEKNKGQIKNYPYSKVAMDNMTFASHRHPPRDTRNVRKELFDLLLIASLLADVLWGLFLSVTHSFLVTNKNKPHRTSAGRLTHSLSAFVETVGTAPALT